MANKRLQCLKKVKMLNSKIMNFKLIIYADFKSILMSADDEKQNPE